MATSLAEILNAGVPTEESAAIFEAMIPLFPTPQTITFQIDS